MTPALGSSAIKTKPGQLTELEKNTASGGSSREACVWNSGLASLDRVTKCYCYGVLRLYYMFIMLIYVKLDFVYCRMLCIL